MKKDKGVAVANSISPNNSGEDTEKDSLLPTIRFSSRNASSKYDFVKIPNHVAIKIALELKKLLIDNSLLDVSQSDLEANLFKISPSKSTIGNSCVWNCLCREVYHCYSTGTKAKFAECPTDMVYELLRTATDAPLASTPVWARDFSSSEELITEFCRECRVVRKGLAGDLKKAMKDGKPIIIEGIHIDPSIYLMDDESKTPANVPEKSKEANQVAVTCGDSTETEMENNSTNVCGSDSKKSNYPGHVSSEEGILADNMNKVSDTLESISLAGSVPGSKGESLKDPEINGNASVRKEKSGAEPIIVPIVLKMSEFDHKALLEEWISTRTFNDKFLVQDKDKLMTNLKTIQDYLCSFKSQGLTVANISATTFPQTLDWLHSYLLQGLTVANISATTFPQTLDWLHSYLLQ
ncbi:hypothetical protein CFP56_041305, partial [Quercus suber]